MLVLAHKLNLYTTDSTIALVYSMESDVRVSLALELIYKVKITLTAQTRARHFTSTVLPPILVTELPVPWSSLSG